MPWIGSQKTSSTTIDLPADIRCSTVGRTANLSRRREAEMEYELSSTETRWPDLHEAYRRRRRPTRIAADQAKRLLSGRRRRRWPHRSPEPRPSNERRTGRGAIPKNTAAIRISFGHRTYQRWRSGARERTAWGAEPRGCQARSTSPAAVARGCSTPTPASGIPTSLVGLRDIGPSSRKKLPGLYLQRTVPSWDDSAPTMRSGLS